MEWHLPALPFDLRPLIAEAKRRARRRRLLVAIVLLVVLAAAAGATYELRSAPGGAATISSRHVALRVGWQASAGRDPTVAAYGDGSVWTASVSLPTHEAHGVLRVPAHGRLFRLDPATGKRTAEIPVGWWPSGIAVGAGSVWVADSLGDGSRLKNHLPGLEDALTRIDPRTNRVVATIRVPNIETVVAGGGAVWVMSSPGGNRQTISRIDPSSDRVTPLLTLRGAPGLVVWGGGRLWALTWFSDPAERARVSEIDPGSGRVVGSVTIEQAGPSSALAYRGGVLWVTAVNPGPGPLRGRIVRIDPRSGAALGKPRLVAGATALASNGAGMWTAGDRSITLLSPATGRAESRLRLPGDVGFSSQTVAASRNMVWVLAGRRVIAVGPGRK